MNGVRAHIGAGSVYLRDWINIDLPSERTFLASERPDLVEKWITTEDRYYGRHADKTIEKLRQGPLHQETVCDRYGSFDFLPVRTGQIEEILCRHVFEHLSMVEAHHALSNIRSVLAKDGILRLDVPDHFKTLQLFQETRDSFYIRHLLGPRRDQRGFHMMSYSPDRLRWLVESHGFQFVRQEENIHIYPAICLRFRKA